MATKMIKALLDFTNKMPEQLLAQGYAIVKALTGNVNFPNLPVDLAVLKAKLDAFAGAIADAKDGSRKAITLRNQMGEEIVRVLQVLAFHVQLNCKDDMNTFLSSGFQPRSSTRTPPRPWSNRQSSVSIRAFRASSWCGSNPSARGRKATTYVAE